MPPSAPMYAAARSIAPSSRMVSGLRNSKYRPRDLAAPALHAWPKPWLSTRTNVAPRPAVAAAVAAKALAATHASSSPESWKPPSAHEELSTTMTSYDTTCVAAYTAATACAHRAFVLWLTMTTETSTVAVPSRGWPKDVPWSSAGHIWAICTQACAKPTRFAAAHCYFHFGSARYIIYYAFFANRHRLMRLLVSH